MFKMFNALFGALQSWFTAFGNFGSAAELASSAVVSHAQVMAEAARIHQLSELKRLNDLHGTEVKALA